jgi:hypothetical protein
MKHNSLRGLFLAGLIGTTLGTSSLEAFDNWQITKQQDGWQLTRNGKPFLIKGAVR